MPLNILGTARVQVDFSPLAKKTKEGLLGNPEGNLHLGKEAELPTVEAATQGRPCNLSVERNGNYKRIPRPFLPQTENQKKNNAIFLKFLRLYV